MWKAIVMASVVAFGSADSHDEHYFSQPEAMITNARAKKILGWKLVYGKRRWKPTA